MHVLVFGAGSLGSLLGARLARAAAHEVTLVGRDPHVAAVRESGLAVAGVADFRVHPAAVTDVAGVARDAAVTLVTTKSFDVPAAADALAAASVDPGAVVALPNGMGAEAALAARLDPVVAGTVTAGARLAAPGRVEWLGRGEVTVGPWVPANGVGADGEGGAAGAVDPVDPDVGDREARDDRERAEAAADLAATAFEAADVPCERASASAVRRLRWEKLAVNAAINPTTALARVTNGAVAEPPLWPLARRAAVETARVARANGVDLADDAAAARARSVARRTADNRSSMRQDVEAGRRTEVDAISGAVLDAAADTDVATPVTEVLAGLVRGWERECGLRPE